MVAQVSPVDISVLISGESGTGKEIFAKAIHQNSKRSHESIVTVNCGAIPEGIIESELFGHKKGAYTDAKGDRKGYFESDNKGTIFLDEIGDMPPDTQTRLLRVLSDGEFYRVGGHTSIKVDVRIIAATHQNLEDLVTKNSFREDLFHRLNVIRIHIPRLCERREDISQLMEYFLKIAAKELEVEPKILRPETEKYLVGLEWPGNVRQLENFCRWITVMASGREVYLTDLPPELSSSKSTRDENTNWTDALHAWADQQLSLGNTGILDEATPLLERTLIDIALKHTAGRRRDAADLLGWGRNTLTRKIKEFENSDSPSITEIGGR